MRPLLALVLGCGLLSGCGHKSPTEPSAPPPSPINQSVTLAPGQGVTLNSSFVVRFREVVRDSRCPAAANCITGGEAVLAFDIGFSEGRLARYELKSDGAGQTLTVNGYLITVEQVAPYPITSNSINPADYRATVRVTA